MLPLCIVCSSIILSAAATTTNASNLCYWCLQAQRTQLINKALLERADRLRQFVQQVIDAADLIKWHRTDWVQIMRTWVNQPQQLDYERQRCFICSGRWLQEPELPRYTLENGWACGSFCKVCHMFCQDMLLLNESFKADSVPVYRSPDLFKYMIESITCYILEAALFIEDGIMKKSHSLKAKRERSGRIHDKHEVAFIQMLHKAQLPCTACQQDVPCLAEALIDYCGDDPANVMSGPSKFTQGLKQQQQQHHVPTIAGIYCQKCCGSEYLQQQDQQVPETPLIIRDVVVLAEDDEACVFQMEL